MNSIIIVTDGSVRFLRGLAGIADKSGQVVKRDACNSSEPVDEDMEYDSIAYDQTLLNN